MSKPSKSRLQEPDSLEVTPPGEPFVARRLKPGPGLAPDLVSADQRARLLEAMVELTVVDGFEEVTVRALAQRAGVSSRTFYRQFADTADCLGAASEMALMDGLEHLEEARAGSETRADAVRASVTSFMCEVAAAPEVARVALFESSAGGRSVQHRVETTLGTYEQAFAKVLEDSPGYVTFGPRLNRGVVGAILGIAKKTAIAGEAQKLPGLVPVLSCWILRLVDSLPAPTIDPAADHDVPPFRRRADRLAAVAPASVADERTRILRASLRIASEEGLHALTGPRVRRVAEVSRRHFDTHFVDVNECFLESMDWLARTAVARAWEWAESSPTPQLRTQRFLRALCAQVARNSALSHLLFVEMPRSGRKGVMRREQLLSEAASGIQRLPLRSSPDGLAGEASAAALWEITSSEVAAGRGADLPRRLALFERLISL
jgi:AcrR family transcriptional regulator